LDLPGFSFCAARKRLLPRVSAGYTCRYFLLPACLPAVFTVTSPFCWIAACRTFWHRSRFCCLLPAFLCTVLDAANAAACCGFAPASYLPTFLPFLPPVRFFCMPAWVSPASTVFLHRFVCLPTLPACVSPACGCLPPQIFTCTCAPAVPAFSTVSTFF